MKWYKLVFAGIYSVKYLLRIDLPSFPSLPKLVCPIDQGLLIRGHERCTCLIPAGES